MAFNIWDKIFNWFKTQISEVRMKPRLLLIYDEKVIGESLQDVLEKEGYDVQTAVDGGEALTMFRERAFAVVVLDMRMPVADGVQVLKKIKAMHSTCQVIVIKGNADLEETVRALRLHAFDFVQRGEDLMLNDLKDSSRKAVVLYENNETKTARMNPKSYFESNVRPMENGFLYALISKECVDVYNEAIRLAAKTREFVCEYSFGSEEYTKIYENIQRAEVILFDLSMPSPRLFLLLGVTLIVRESKNVVVISHQKGSLNGLSVMGDYYDSKNLEALRAVLESRFDIIRCTRPLWTSSPFFKNQTTKILLKAAMEATENREWAVAETLFESMQEKEPYNWYVLTQWGIMLREQRENDKADSKFSMALEFTRFDSEKALVYVEKAAMHQAAKDHKGADQWFEKARGVDPTNLKLYFAWAKFWDECGEPTRAACKILEMLNHVDAGNEDGAARYRYYFKKIEKSSYKKGFEEFLEEEKNHQIRNSKPRRLRSVDYRPCAKGNSKIDYGISWEEFHQKVVGQILEGVVKNVDRFGVFVTLTRDFYGLIHESQLPAGFHKSFALNQRIRVRVMSAVLDSNNNQMIGLELIQA